MIELDEDLQNEYGQHGLVECLHQTEIVQELEKVTDDTKEKSM